MCINSDARRLAVSHFDVAVGLIASRGANVGIQELALEALELRDADSIDALVRATEGGPWERGLLYALAQVTILTAQDVLLDVDEVAIMTARPFDRRVWSTVIAQLRGGVSIHEVNALGLGEDWWDVVSAWVDNVRGGK